MASDSKGSRQARGAWQRAQSARSQAQSHANLARAWARKPAREKVAA